VARRILAAVEVRASEAESHADALEHCAREMPDCIVIDWMMPSNGSIVTLMRNIRALPGGERPLIFYLVSEYTDADFAAAKQNGANALMMKPFDRETFLRPLVESGFLAP
jgi:two-component system chemotaxis response regulator CheY